MLVGLESMEEFTSKTMILSRKLFGLHLILWMQPIALKNNTIQTNVLTSGKTRMDTALLVLHQLRPHDKIVNYHLSGGCWERLFDDFLVCVCVCVCVCVLKYWKSSVIHGSRQFGQLYSICLVSSPIHSRMSVHPPSSFKKH